MALNCTVAGDGTSAVGVCVAAVVALTLRGAVLQDDAVAVIVTVNSHTQELCNHNKLWIPLMLIKKTSNLLELLLTLALVSTKARLAIAVLGNVAALRHADASMLTRQTSNALAHVAGQLRVVERVRPPRLALATVAT